MCQCLGLGVIAVSIAGTSISPAASMIGVESVLDVEKEAAISSVVAFRSPYGVWIRLRRRARANCVVTKWRVPGSVGSIIEIWLSRATKEAYPTGMPLFFFRYLTN